MRTNWNVLHREVIGSCLLEILDTLFDRYLHNLIQGPDFNRRLDQMNSRYLFPPRLFCDSVTLPKKTQFNSWKNVYGLNLSLV